MLELLADRRDRTVGTARKSVRLLATSTQTPDGTIIMSPQPSRTVLLHLS